MTDGGPAFAGAAKTQLTRSRSSRILTEGVPQLPDLNDLSHAEKDALIRALWQRLEVAEQRVAELEARLGEPSKTPDNSSLPPSKGQKPNQPVKGKRIGPRQGSLGRKGGGRPLACDPDEAATAKALACAHCQFTLTDADQVLHGRYDKIDLPMVRPVVTRVERYAGHCRCYGGVTLAAIATGLEGSRRPGPSPRASRPAGAPWRGCGYRGPGPPNPRPGSRIRPRSRGSG